MIKPVSPQSDFQSSLEPLPFIQPVPFHHQSTLQFEQSKTTTGVIQTLQTGAQKIGTLVAAIFSKVWNLITGNWWTKPKRNPPPKNMPEFNPATLSADDPFRNQVFAFNENGKWSYIHKKASDLCHQLFDRLATGMPIGPWGIYKSVTLGNELRATPHHPLEFLYFNLVDYKRIEKIHDFESWASKPSKQNIFILKSLHISHPWDDQFLRNQVNGFKRNENNILPLLPGFCKALHLDLQKVEKFAHDKNWEDLILHVLNERKKQFNL